MSVLNVIKNNHGYVNSETIMLLASESPTTMLLVRCNMGRFLVLADQAKHYIDMVSDSNNGDYVRDVSIAKMS